LNHFLFIAIVDSKLLQKKQQTPDSWNVLTAVRLSHCELISVPCVEAQGMVHVEFHIILFPLQQELSATTDKSLRAQRRCHISTEVACLLFSWLKPLQKSSLPLSTVRTSKNGSHEGDEGDEGNEGHEGDEGNEGDEGDEGDEGNESHESNEGHEVICSLMMAMLASFGSFDAPK